MCFGRVAKHILQRLFPCGTLAAQGHEQLQDNQKRSTEYATSERFKGLVRYAPAPACYELVSCEEFHLPLLECALKLVAHVSSPKQVHTWLATLQRFQQQTCMYGVQKHTFTDHVFGL